MKTGKFYRKAIIGLFFLFFAGQMHAQLYLVSGTKFEAPGYENEMYVSLNEIEHIGLVRPQISVSSDFVGLNEALVAYPCKVQFATNIADFFLGRYYAVTNNPSKLSPLLFDNNEAYWGFVMSPFSATCGTALPNSNILRFKVPGLKPGAAVRVEVEFCVASTTVPATLPQINIAFNGRVGNTATDNSGANMLRSATYYGTFPNRNPGTCANTVIVNSGNAPVASTGVVPPSGVLDLAINGNQTLNAAIVIKSVKIYSEIGPVVAGAAKTCAGGETSILSVDAYSGAITYQWYKNGTKLEGETGRTYIHVAGDVGNQTHNYRYDVTFPNETGGGTTTASSFTFVAKDTVCCVNEEAKPMSRKLIWQDDFGTFENGTTYWKWDYTDITNPKKVYVTPRMAWRTDVPYAIPGAIWSPGTGANALDFGEGKYTVIANIGGAGSAGMPLWTMDTGDGRHPNLKGWAYFPDHTYLNEWGTYGACLMLNCGNEKNAVIFRQEIPNLCKTTVTVKCFINCFSNSASPVMVKIRVTELGVPSNTITSFPTTVRYSVNAVNDNAWREASVTLDLTTTNGVLFEVISEAGGRQENENGNDLLLDDIQVFACATPTVEFFADSLNYHAEVTTCKGTGIKFHVNESPMLQVFYGAELAYIYQYNTKDPSDASFKTSWININTVPVTNTTISDSYVEEIFATVRAAIELAGQEVTGAKVHFRVVAGKYPDLEGKTYFNPDDPCKEVSVAEFLTAEFDCSCPTPAKLSIGANKPVVRQFVTVCPDEVITLNVRPSLKEQCEVQWFQSDTRPATGDTPLHTGNTFSLSESELGTKTYFVKVIDGTEKDNVRCWRFDSVFVKVSLPAVNETTDICPANPIEPTEEICFNFRSAYANGSYTGTNAASMFLAYKTNVSTSALGDTIKVAAGNYNPVSVCVDGVNVDVAAVSGKDTLYHIYLQDVTPIPAQGTLAGNYFHNTTAGSATTRILLEVKNAITLKEVTLYGQAPSNSGPGTSRTCYIVPYIATAATGGTITNIASQQTFTHQKQGPVLPMVIDLENYVLAPGTYWLGFAVTGDLERIYCSTSPVTTNGGQTFTNRLTDDIIIGGWALFGNGTNTTNTTNGQFIISDLIFNTLVPPLSNCDRVKLTSKYLCPECVRPFPDDATNKRVNIITDAGTKIEADTIIVLCKGEDVDLKIKRLKLNETTDATNQFDIFWYQGSKTSTPVRESTSVANGTDTYKVEAWTLPNPTVADVRKYYVKVRDHAKTMDEVCWAWDSIYVKVNPTPELSSNLTPSPVCSGTEFNYMATSATAGTTFSWTRAAISGITPATGSGESIINEVLTNGTASAIPVIYKFTLSTGGCTYTQDVTVIVNPKPVITLTSIAETEEQTICEDDNIVNITYSLSGGATGATVSDLPGGVAFDVTGNTLVISGKPTGTGTFNYTVTTSGHISPCTAATATGKIVVNSNPTVIPITDKTFCGGESSGAIYFSSTATNPTFTWTNDNTNIGLAASGTGDINSFTATNNGNTPITGTVTVIPTAGCEGAPETFDITVNPKAVVTLSSPSTTADQTICEDSDITNITYTLSGGATDATVSSLPGGVVFNVTGNTLTISGKPTGTGTSNYTVTTSGHISPCTAATANGKITVNETPAITLTSATETAGQTICETSAIANITYSLSSGAGASATGLPDGVTGSISGSVFTISGTPEKTGTFNYTVTTTGAPSPCTEVSVNGKIEINPLPVITLTTSGADNQTICENGAITNIAYSLSGGATGASATGLPDGVTGSVSGGVFTISGTPIETGTFDYKVTTTGETDPCLADVATGTIVINKKSVIDLTSNAGTDSQTICETSAIDNIEYTLGGSATGASAAGLPKGVTGSVSGGVFTISGTPEETGPFSYTVTTTGHADPCVAVTATGTIVVNAKPAITLTSAAGTSGQTICETSVIANITYSLSGGATNALVEGLPNGVTGSVSGGVFTISGTPIETGTFDYKVTTTGETAPCVAAVTSGTIVVNPKSGIILTSGSDNQTKCETGAIDNITYTFSGSATDVSVTGLPNGVTGSVSGSLFAISGTPTQTGIFDYKVTTIGHTAPCAAVTVTGKIVVNPKPVITLTSGATTTEQTICEKASIVDIRYSLSGGATGANISNLPAGVTYSVSGDGILTISGTPAQTGTFNYTVTTTGHTTPCTPATESGKIVINPLPSIIKEPLQTICEGSSVDLRVVPNSPSAVITWKDNNTVIGTGTAITVKPPYIKSGSSYRSTYHYTVTVSDNCQETFDIPVEVDGKLTGTIETSSPQACEGSYVTMNAGSYNAETYIWTSQAFDTDKSTATITELLEVTTTYYLKVMRGECDEYEDVTIDVNSNPVILSIDSVGIRDREIIFDPAFGTQPFKYGIDNEPVNDNPVKYNLLYSLHTFYIVDAAGCYSTAYESPVMAPKLIIPHYFSPNGDGINDIWEIEGLRDSYPDAVVTIFDRFGKELIKYKGTGDGWDGKYLGRDMPATDYWYVIEIKEINKQYTGHFTLLRR